MSAAQATYSLPLLPFGCPSAYRMVCVGSTQLRHNPSRHCLSRKRQRTRKASPSLNARLQAARSHRPLLAACTVPKRLGLGTAPFLVACFRPHRRCSLTPFGRNLASPQDTGILSSSLAAHVLSPTGLKEGVSLKAEPAGYIAYLAVMLTCARTHTSLSDCGTAGPSLNKSGLGLPIVPELDCEAWTSTPCAGLQHRITPGRTRAAHSCGTQVW